jgi:hypothetical protein
MKSTGATTNEPSAALSLTKKCLAARAILNIYSSRFTTDVVNAIHRCEASAWPERCKDLYLDLIVCNTPKQGLPY